MPKFKPGTTDTAQILSDLKREISAEVNRVSARERKDKDHVTHLKRLSEAVVLLSKEERALNAGDDSDISFSSIEEIQDKLSKLRGESKTIKGAKKEAKKAAERAKKDAEIEMGIKEALDNSKTPDHIRVREKYNYEADGIPADVWTKQVEESQRVLAERIRIRKAGGDPDAQYKLKD